MRWREHIERRPGVLGGKPVVKGTRINVEIILERLGNGATDADLIECFPSITPADIRATQSFAAAAIAMEQAIVLDAVKA